MAGRPGLDGVDAGRAATTPAMKENFWSSEVKRLRYSPAKFFDEQLYKARLSGVICGVAFFGLLAWADFDVAQIFLRARLAISSFYQTSINSTTLKQFEASSSELTEIPTIPPTDKYANSIFGHKDVLHRLILSCFFLWLQCFLWAIAAWSGKFRCAAWSEKEDDVGRLLVGNKRLRNTPSWSLGFLWWLTELIGHESMIFHIVHNVGLFTWQGFMGKQLSGFFRILDGICIMAELCVCFILTQVEPFATCAVTVHTDEFDRVVPLSER